MRRRLLIWLPVALITLIASGVIVVITVWPPVAALACPQCFGLVPIADQVYAEPDLDPEQRDRMLAMITAARRKIVAGYGSDSGTPRILVCRSADCYRRIGGGAEAGVAIMNRGLILAPRGADPVIATHELSHVEFHRRSGSATVPQWFDEGLAVVISDDRRYLGPAGSAERCRAEPDGPLPETLGAWLEAASADELTYARAACAVDRWVEGHGGLTAVPDLTRRLAAGEPFSEAVR